MVRTRPDDSRAALRDSRTCLAGPAADRVKMMGMEPENTDVSAGPRRADGDTGAGARPPSAADAGHDPAGRRGTLARIAGRGLGRGGPGGGPPVRRGAQDPVRRGSRPLEVIEEAIEWGAELLITHHPLLLKGVTSVAANTAKGKAVHRLIESGTALLTVHTNGDSAVGGVSDVLADALGLQDVAPADAGGERAARGRHRPGRRPRRRSMTLGDFAARVFGILPVRGRGSAGLRRPGRPRPAGGRLRRRRRLAVRCRSGPATPTST